MAICHWVGVFEIVGFWQLLLVISIPAQAGMISNPRFIVGRKVESGGQQIIRAIFSFLTPPSTVNSQQSTITDGATGIDIKPAPKIIDWILLFFCADLLNR